MNLRARGFKTGDTLALNSPNSIYYPVLFHAVSRLGGRLTTINPLYEQSEVEFQVGVCVCARVFTVFFSSSSWVSHDCYWLPSVQTHARHMWFVVARRASPVICPASRHLFSIFEIEISLAQLRR